MEYIADDGIASSVATGATIVSPVTSPVTGLAFDPDELVHTLITRCYDRVGNFSDNVIKFPPIVSFSTPTLISNTSITDAQVTVTSPLDNDLDNLLITSTTGTPTLANCIGDGGDVVAPYASPVTCDINGVTDSMVITVAATDIGTTAE